MKDIYELLNDIDIDENEFEEMQVNNVEKSKIKKRLKKSISKKINWKRRFGAVAFIGIISTAIFGAVFPAAAKNIPIVGDIFRALDNEGTGLYDNYKKNASEINVTKESNGISITVDDAIFDGKTVSLTYTVKSDKDLGKNFFFNGGAFQLKKDDSTGGSGTSKFIKIGENTYIGHEEHTLSDFVDNPRNSVAFQLDIDTIITHNKEISGHWRFDINLNAVKGNVKVVNQSVEKEGILASIKRIDINPMSMNIVYSQKVPKSIFEDWDDIYLDLNIKDDLGNVYSGQGNGGHGDIQGNMTWSKTFEKLKAGATKLIITPKIELRTNTSENSGGVELDENGKEKPIIPVREGIPQTKELTLNDIVVELNK